MDEKDIRILAAIAETGTDSPEKIHQETDIPTSTVHYRIRHLREEGIIRNNLFDLDLEKLGLSITLISEVWAEFEEGYHNRVGEKLSNVEGVNQVYFTLGDTDFILVSHLANREMVQDIVEDFEAIDEITRTSSKFVITTIKDEPYAVNDFDLDTLLDVLCEPDD